MCATILAVARIIPIRKIDAGLKVFSNSDLELVTKICAGKPIIKSHSCVVFNFE